ncbi:MAG: carboxylating nicotinate-nucleotide diphosphorylase [Myxococcota bacterium]|nr:carboxylating nicotinate-nucleotide diphosphorylase [Myxococcota bacterium]MDW8363900.1 carboxylating nicotinate-nucleotide diphosphorylase [Myxococcales bacterium]
MTGTLPPPERGREIPPPRAVVERIVALALAEDLGRGDVTTEACVPPGVRGEAHVVARQPLVLAGLGVLREVYRQVDPEVEVHDRARDGDALERGQPVAHLHGRAASILAGERVALNFVQHLSGIATTARRFVEALPPGSRTRITDTRKTTPGLRPLERYAVRCGGAHNHREDLSSAVLIKDNHIAAAGGVRAAIERARRHAPHTSRIECEVEDLEQLREALDAGAEVVLLDNFDDEMLPEAIALARGRALVEVSGGVTLARVPIIAAAGADVISAGALTLGAPAVDLGLDWIGP